MKTFTFNDGGRSAAGFSGQTRDCVTRSIAIATGMPYKGVYDCLDKLAPLLELRGRAKHSPSSARTGVRRKVYERLLSGMGWKWTPTMTIGSGCKVHLRADELPQGRLIVRVTKHLTCVIDVVINDTHDPSRNGTRCVYGYWRVREPLVYPTVVPIQ